MTSPYAMLADHQFWRRSVANIEPHRLDPVTDVRVRIGPDTVVATAGSCFAQHISRELSRAGLRYLVSERGEHLPVADRVRKNYGLFSSRYGNIYSPSQLRQLLEHAFDGRIPIDTHWIRPDGRLIDPVRQQVDPDGFADVDELLLDRETHLAAVRSMFCETEVFVFTLGLTEYWQSRDDGTIFSSPPGAVGGEFDPERHEFANLSFNEAWDHLAEALTKIKEINPGITVLLTVSPVPLIATYENRAVLVSNSVSKSILRAIADQATRIFDWVDYFPSYEIITSSRTSGQYYEGDERSVNRLGVAHAMRSFMAHYIEGIGRADVGTHAAMPLGSNIFCDEDAIDAVSF